MFKIKNTRQIIIVFIAFALIFFIFSDKIVTYVSTLNPFLILFLTIFLNPIYILFIYKMWEDYGIKGAVGGLLISIASDVLSLPHIFEMNGTLSQSSFNLVTDDTFWHLIPDSLKFTLNIPYLGPVNFAVILIYLIVTVGLVILALMITHKRKFKEIFLKSV